MTNDTSEIRIIHTTDYNSILNTIEQGDCVHLLCKQGGGTVVYGGRDFHFKAHEIAILSRIDQIQDISYSDDVEIECLIAPLQFLYNQLPANHPGIVGCIDLWDNPVLPLRSDSEREILHDFERLKTRISDTNHVFYKEIIGSLALTMVYDLFNIHTERDGGIVGTESNFDIVSRLIELLSSGKVREHRDVAYYAEQLHVSSKYLGNIVKRQTGHSVQELINQYTVPMIREYLDSNRYSLTQIADIFHFNTVSYFSRYVQKHIGMSPSEYRAK